MIDMKHFRQEWYSTRRPQFVDAQATSYQAFMDRIEFDEAFPENEHLAIQVIQMLQKKYNLMF